MSSFRGTRFVMMYTRVFIFLSLSFLLWCGEAQKQANSENQNIHDDFNAISVILTSSAGRELDTADTLAGSPTTAEDRPSGFPDQIDCAIRSCGSVDTSDCRPSNSRRFNPRRRNICKRISNFTCRCACRRVDECNSVKYRNRRGGICIFRQV